MSKLKYLQSSQEKKREYIKESSTKLRSALNYLKSDFDLNQTEIAKSMSISQPTLSKKLRKPEELTIGELFAMKYDYPNFKFSI